MNSDHADKIGQQAVALANRPEVDSCAACAPWIPRMLEAVADLRDHDAAVLAGTQRIINLFDDPAARTAAAAELADIIEHAATGGSASAVAQQTANVIVQCHRASLEMPPV